MHWPKFDWKNIDWFSPKPSKERFVIGCALIAVLGLGYYLFGGDASSPEGKDAPGVASTNAIDNPSASQGPVALSPVQSGQCSTQAPEGWRVVDQNQQGTVFTLASADSSEYAAYAGVAVNSGQVSGLYGAQYRTPESVALFSAGAIVSEEAQQTGPAEMLGPYKVLRFSTPNHIGYALLYTFPVAADPGGFGLIMRIALGRVNDLHSLASAGSVAAVIRCASVVVPRDNSDLPRHGSEGSDHGTGKSEDGDLAGTYNAQLGIGWVHDDTGRNYRVDVTTDYHETGPDGPGYYKSNGTKLTPGFQ